MNVQVDIWLRGQDFATTKDISGITTDPSLWTDEDVKAVLLGMLEQMHRLKHPEQEPNVTLRGLSWIVNPFEGGVVIAIEITLGAAVAGPFGIDQEKLETMITRVLAPSVPTSGTVH